MNFKPNRQRRTVEEEDSDSESVGTRQLKTDRYGFQGGSQFDNCKDNAISRRISMRRERKWILMTKDLIAWKKWMRWRRKKVIARCCKGIPSSVRGKAWQYLSGSYEIKRKHGGEYQILLTKKPDEMVMREIKKDIGRAFPYHEMFATAGGFGQNELLKLLQAYSIHNPSIGYCQAMAPVGALLLMHMETEDAFWCFVTVCEKYLGGFFSPGLEAIQIEGQVFYALLSRHAPMIRQHLDKYEIEPLMFMTEWYMCAFARTLPWSLVLRVWDMLFAEGTRVVHKVAIAIMCLIFDTNEKLQSCPSMYQTLNRLKDIPEELLTGSNLLPQAINIQITEKDIEKIYSTIQLPINGEAL